VAVVIVAAKFARKSDGPDWSASRSGGATAAWCWAHGSEYLAIPWLTQATRPDTASVATIFKILARPWRCGADVYRRRRDGPHHDAADGRARVLGGDRRSSPANGGRLFPVAELRIHSGEAIFIGTILTATSVTITAQSLINLGQLKSRSGPQFRRSGD